jgi:hypothetical protein
MQRSVRYAEKNENFGSEWSVHVDTRKTQYGKRTVECGEAPKSGQVLITLMLPILLYSTAINIYAPNINILGSPQNLNVQKTYLTQTTPYFVLK